MNKEQLSIHRQHELDIDVDRATSLALSSIAILDRPVRDEETNPAENKIQKSANKKYEKVKKISTRIFQGKYKEAGAVFTAGVMLAGGLVFAEKSNASETEEKPVDLKKSSLMQVFPEKKELITKQKDSAKKYTSQHNAEKKREEVKAQINPNMALLSEARTQLGNTEDAQGNSMYGYWYEKNIDSSAKFSDKAWCDMFVTWVAHKAGVDKFTGDFAYTPTHAQWFKDKGAWGTTPQPGSVVFFNWPDGEAIDHVGIVESVDPNGEIHTIEGNTGGNPDENTKDQVMRRIRNKKDVVGYGYPSVIAQKKN